MGNSKACTAISFLVLFFSVYTITPISSTSLQLKFIKCLLDNSDVGFPIDKTFFTPERNATKFNEVLASRAHNLRYLRTSTPKPELIFKPVHESHVQASIICSKKFRFQLIVRSGGHDYEALSYASLMGTPFIMIELAGLNQIEVDIEDNSAWVQAGATLGQVYYRIAEKSNIHGFPSGMCSTVGVGGHITAGGDGAMMRKYGLAADNVQDAKIVDANGKILDRNLMGEDLFWAIRGGSGGNFGIILAWKLKLVPVPEIVTVYRISRPIEQEAGYKTLQKWQRIANKIAEELYILLEFSVAENKTVTATYRGQFIGEKRALMEIMHKDFPELGFTQEDGFEMSWIKAKVFDAGFPIGTPIEYLLDPTKSSYGKTDFKGMSDYVIEPISELGLSGMFKRMIEEKTSNVLWIPYGGMMARIPESKLPFPHRKGVNFKIHYGTFSTSTDEQSSNKRLKWIRELYKYMTPHVSSNPRLAYVGYRDLDLGKNTKNAKMNFIEAQRWGAQYFKDNFDRLVEIKTMVDPKNFFRHEQSIPPLPFWKKISSW